MRRAVCGLLAAALVAAVGTSAPVPKKANKPEHGEKNTNALVTKHKEKIAMTATSDWGGRWVVANLIDGDEATSWYSKDPDTTATGKNNPVVTLTFPDDVTVKRVTLLGNRDPEYADEYTVSEGTIELLDKNDKVIAKHEMKGEGEKSDFDLKLEQFQSVRGVRFTCTKSQNGYVGVGEFMVE
jgi:hypothetical protein